jgi:hypothetical protein
MVDRVDLGHHSQGRIPSARKMAEAACGVADGLRAVTSPALTTASTAAIAAVLAAVCNRRTQLRHESDFRNLLAGHVVFGLVS